MKNSAEIAMKYLINNLSFLLLTIMLFYSCKENVSGCTVPQATNYNPNANLDDGSCTFAGQFIEGQIYGGGVIFYIDSSGQHGLIASSVDQTTAQSWSNGTDILTNANGFSIGTGGANTAFIVSAQGSGFCAACICDTLTLNGNNDWFLPSTDELRLMYIQRGLIGGFSSTFYWSSTENTVNTADCIHMTNGSESSNFKSNGFGVRAIRAF